MTKLFIKTFGCTLNKKDSLDVINNNSFTEDFSNIKHAKFILINTCGVKERTQTKIINYLTQLKTKKINQKKIIVFGCLVDIDKDALTKVLPDALYFKVSEKNKIKKIIGEGKLKIEKKEITKIIVISNGCLGNCNYCAVKFARGKLKSKPIKQIILEINQEIKNKNVKEIYLTSQDNGCYGKDISKNLIDLLKEIVKIKGDFKIRLGMANPQYLLPMLNDLIDIYADKKMYKFIHIPIQSGDDDVLKDMNRGYTINEVRYIIKTFKRKIKNITIATDLIVGYPTETNSNFNNTLKLIREIKPDFINISRFGQRKNIEANKLKDLSGTIKKERSRKLTEVFENIILKKNKKEIGKIKEILITEIGKNKTSVGKTNEYKSVVIKAKIQIGTKLKVKIIAADKYYLLGEIINPKKNKIKS
jgi:threonylcarbamoyladenosine tRNA methylthiotransferase CDKAL1